MTTSAIGTWFHVRYDRVDRNEDYLKLEGGMPYISDAHLEEARIGAASFAQRVLDNGVGRRGGVSIERVDRDTRDAGGAMFRVTVRGLADCGEIYPTTVGRYSVVI